MANNAIIGEWNYCPDGVKLSILKPGDDPLMKLVPSLMRPVEFGNLDRKWLKPGQRSNAILAYQTERRGKKHLEMDPKNPTVVEFVNAENFGKLRTFFGKYGLPDVENDQTPLDTVVIIQDRMCALLDAYSLGAVAETIETFEKILPEFSIRPDLKISPGTNDVALTLRCSNLAGFMTMELAAIIAGNAQVLRCIHCNNIFTTGVGGARKKTAHYCSNKCRVAAQRAAAKAKEESAGQQSKEQKGT